MTNQVKGKINISILFLLLYMGLASWLVYFNLYLEEIGFTGSEIGIITGILQGTLFFVVPIWGIIGDNFGINKILRIAIAGTAIFLFCFQMLDDFYTVILYMLPFSFFLHPLGPLQDSMAVNFVRDNNTSSFGQFRVWGSIGWAIASFTLGYFISKENVEKIFFIAPVVLLSMLFFIRSQNETQNERKFSETKLEQFKVLLKNRPLVIFCVIIFIYGVFLSPLNLFINLYFKELGADFKIVGLAFTFQCIAEIPFFFLGIKIVKKIGAENSILISVLVTLARVVLYSQITDPSIALFIGLGQGFTLSLFLVAVVEFVHDMVPANLRATGQSLIWAFHFGAGITIGNFIIGYFYEIIGMRSVMQYNIFFITAVVVLLYLYFRKPNQKLI